jgi:hypothetical protein
MAENLPACSVNGSFEERHIQLPKGAKEGATGRYVRLEIRVPWEDYERGFPYFGSREKLNEFAVEALRERINRAEASDKNSRLRKMIANMDELLPALKELARQGKLEFLKDGTGKTI